jgi:hypothetical protein
MTISTEVIDLKKVRSYIPQIHVLKIAAIHRKTKEEKTFEMEFDSDRFCNVIAEFRYINPGWAIEDTWEINSYTDEVLESDRF